MQNLRTATIIKTLCKEKNISITSLIENCNLSKGFIYEMEKRNKTPLVDKVEAIANYLNCSIDYLLGRTDNPNMQSSTNNISGSVTNSAVVQGTNNANLIINNEKIPEHKLSKQAIELLKIFNDLNVREQTELLSLAFEIESRKQKK